MVYRCAAGAALAFLTLAGAAFAEECPGNSHALGTSRVIALNTQPPRKLGRMHYDETLPLEDHEIVLTFDDGPLPPHTPRVLDALAAECVKATFFVVGQMAQAYPAIVQREQREGHTIGTHTEHHRSLNRVSVDVATKEITDGIASRDKALGGPQATPFFRFPYFNSTPAEEAAALKLGLTIWSTDFHASDWERIRPQQVAALAIARLERQKKGILLLHDIHDRTVVAVPLLLHELKSRGFHVVHVVAAGAEPKAAAGAESAANPGAWKPELQDSQPRSVWPSLRRAFGF
jgi:peptidoglycan/xylan/chitin deacetylase (PgdA/CDA1 family)